MLTIYANDARRCSHASYTWGSFLLQQNFQHFRLSSQPSDRGLSAVCWSCLGDNLRRSRPLYIKTHFLTWHDSRHVVCLHNPQTGVRPQCARILGSLSTTFGIVVHLYNPQTGVCPLLTKVPSWLQPSVLPFVASQESSLRLPQLSALSYVFTALRPQSVHCVVGLVFCLAQPLV